MTKAEEFLAKFNALLKEYEASFYIPCKDACISAIVVGDQWIDVKETGDGFEMRYPLRDSYLR